MCRNIKPLFNFEPPATRNEVHEAALQFVRKISGFNKPSQANEAAFHEAVEDVEKIVRKMLKPDWAPPPEVKHDIPAIPDFIRGGTPGNPLGVAALVMTGGDYAIHGTNRPGSVGGFVSYGCIRMQNADIMDLYQRVHIGTPVTVTK